MLYILAMYCLEGLAVEKDTLGFYSCFSGQGHRIASSALLQRVKEQRL